MCLDLLLCRLMAADCNAPPMMRENPSERDEIVAAVTVLYHSTTILRLVGSVADCIYWK